MIIAVRQILELITKLPPTAQAELFDFAEFLLHNHGPSEQALSSLEYSC